MGRLGQSLFFAWKSDKQSREVSFPLFPFSSPLPEPHPLPVHLPLPADSSLTYFLANRLPLEGVPKPYSALLHQLPVARPTSILTKLLVLNMPSLKKIHINAVYWYVVHCSLCPVLLPTC